MRRLMTFLTTMDRQAWRSLAISFVLFGGVGMVFLFGAQVLGFNGEATVEHWLGSATGPWALPAAVGAFAGLAFLGVPQFVLIAAAVVAFGPGTVSPTAGSAPWSRPWWASIWDGWRGRGR